ncbi:MAG: DUF4287 domain-containing protein [Nocardioides sp.]|jgi:uncharacterized protein DUF4287
MSFNGYLKTIESRTSLGPDDFRTLAAERGLLEGGNVEPGEVIAWLARDYGLGRGHAMAVVAVLRNDDVAVQALNGKDI